MKEGYPKYYRITTKDGKLCELYKEIPLEGYEYIYCGSVFPIEIDTLFINHSLIYKNKDLIEEEITEEEMFMELI